MASATTATPVIMVTAATPIAIVDQDGDRDKTAGKHQGRQQ